MANKYDRESREMSLENNPVWQAYQRGEIDIEGIKRGAAGQLNNMPKQSGGLLQRIGQGIGGVAKTIGPGLAEGIGNVGDILLQQGGITPQKKTQPSQFDELIKLETLKSKREADALAREKAELDIKAKKAELEQKSEEYERDKKIKETESILKGNYTPMSSVSQSGGGVMQEPTIGSTDQGNMFETRMPTMTPQETTRRGGSLEESARNIKYGDVDVKLKNYKRDLEQGVREAAKKESGKEMTEKFGQASRLVNAFASFVSESKRADNALEKDPIFGLIHGTGTGLNNLYEFSQSKYAPTWLQERLRDVFTAEGQTAENIVAAMPILSGQARFVVDLAKLISKTIPGIGVQKDIRFDLVAQSTKNMMRLLYGIINGQLGAEKLIEMGIDPDSSPTDEEVGKIVLNSIKLRPEQTKVIDDAVSYVINAPEAKPYEEYEYNFDTMEEALKADIPAGTEITIGGKKAIVRED